MGGIVTLTQQLLTRTLMGSTLIDVLDFRNVIAPIKDFLEQFRISGRRGVVFLNSGIGEHYLTFVSLRMHSHRVSEELSFSFFANAPPRKNTADMDPVPVPRPNSHRHSHRNV